MSATNYIELNPKNIIETINTLTSRIHERFPESGLEKVSKSLLQIAQELSRRINEFQQPIWWLRLLTFLMIGVLVSGVFGIFFSMHFPEKFNFFEFIQVLEAGINDVVLIGLGIFFLIGLEERIKRRRALHSIHTLRTVAHVIDMHQLTKDPERLQARLISTTSSPNLPMDEVQLGRYLTYCSEMLSLIGKLAALHLAHLSDPIVLDSVNEIEELTTGLSGKIWQKLSMLHQANR